MSSLTATEKRVLAIMLIGGRINEQEFNTLCNADDINKHARNNAVKRIEKRPKLLKAVSIDYA